MAPAVLAFIAAVWALLAQGDPGGFARVQEIARQIEARTPLTYNGQRHAALAYLGEKVLVDWVLLGWTFWPDEARAQKWAACVLVHEAVHMQYHTVNELPALWRQYICLDKLGAPQADKDFIYSLILKGEVPSGEEE